MPPLDQNQIDENENQEIKNPLSPNSSEQVEPESIEPEKPQVIQPQAPKSTTSRKKLAIALALLILLSAGGAAAYLYLDRDESSPASNQQEQKNQHSFAVDALPTSQSVPLSAEYAASQNSFGFNLLKTLNEKDQEENIFISPSSISVAMSMVYAGADNQTKEEIKTGLSANNINDEDFHKQNSSLVRLLNKDEEKLQISMANSVWADQPDETNDSFSLKQSYQDTLKQYYGPEAKITDLQSEQAKDNINQWVNDNTSGKIPELVNSNLPDGYLMMLLNAVYFKGTWKYEFDPENTKDDNFTTISGNSQTVPMMSLESDLRYASIDHMQIVDLPYGEDEEYAMTLILPEDINEAINNLDSQKLNEMLSTMTKRPGHIELPKLKLDYQKKLNETLQTLGIRQAFSDRADFSGISDTSLKIDEVKHKTFLEVNEEGTEAAAVTSVGMTMTTSLGSGNFHMKLDKPFIMMIRDTKNNIPLFMGAIKSID